MMYKSKKGSSSNSWEDTGRRMSWSDESGQDLVSYFSEARKKEPSLNIRRAVSGGSNNSSSGEEGEEGGGLGLPKSALKRSGSTLGKHRGMGNNDAMVSGELNSGGGLGGSNLGQFPGVASLTGASPSTLYESTDVVASLPRGFDRSPAQQFFSKGQVAGGTAKSGTVSPQWGWYVSTTPPISQFVKEEVKKEKKEGEKKKLSALSQALGDPDEKMR